MFMEPVVLLFHFILDPGLVFYDLASGRSLHLSITN